jgi:hypothetical protein
MDKVLPRGRETLCDIHSSRNDGRNFAGVRSKKWHVSPTSYLFYNSNSTCYACFTHCDSTANSRESEGSLCGFFGLSSNNRQDGNTYFFASIYIDGTCPRPCLQLPVPHAVLSCLCSCSSSQHLLDWIMPRSSFRRRLRMLEVLVCLVCGTICVLPLWIDVHFLRCLLWRHLLRLWRLRPLLRPLLHLFAFVKIHTRTQKLGCQFMEGNVRCSFRASLLFPDVIVFIFSI